MVCSDGSEPEGLYLVLFRDLDNYHAVLGIDLGFGPQIQDTPYPPIRQVLSTPTSIARKWARNPFEYAMPIPSSQVSDDLRLKTGEVNSDGEISILFPESVADFSSAGGQEQQEAPIDENVLDL